MYFVRDVVIETLVVIRYTDYFCTLSRKVVIFQACIRETSLRRDTSFGPLLCEYVGCMIEFCRVFHVNFSKSRVSKFQNFWGEHAPRPP